AVDDGDVVGEVPPALVLVERLVVRAGDIGGRGVRVAAGEVLIGGEDRAGGGREAPADRARDRGPVRCLDRRREVRRVRRRGRQGRVRRQRRPQQRGVVRHGRGHGGTAGRAERETRAGDGARVHAAREGRRHGA